MAPPSKEQHVRSLPPLHLNLQWNNHMDYGDGFVPADYNSLKPTPTRTEHKLAILAHTRGQSAAGCRREQGGQIRAFKHTIMFMGLLPNGDRVTHRCTNCWYASDSEPCGAAPDFRPPHPPVLRELQPPPVVSPVPQFKPRTVSINTMYILGDREISSLLAGLMRHGAQQRIDVDFPGPKTGKRVGAETVRGCSKRRPFSLASVSTGNRAWWARKRTEPRIQLGTNYL